MFLAWIREQGLHWGYFFKWLFIALFLGLVVGSASALFLAGLDWVTAYRLANPWIILGLPLGGLGVGLLYHYWGGSVVRGNNQLIEVAAGGAKALPLRMAPFILLGTWVTHLFGGSAGREGTAVQMGASLAMQGLVWGRWTEEERQILLRMGMGAGFASLFGTPLAGAIFALEVLRIGSWDMRGFLPVLLASILADEVCKAWGLEHTHYVLGEVPMFDLGELWKVVVAGCCFAWAGRLFAWFGHFWGACFRRWVVYAPFRPLLGGGILVVVVFVFGAWDYLGLGLEKIQGAFEERAWGGDFILKLLFTTFTLGAGFKGGEVTPLFFVGACLGSFLAPWLDLPLGLSAAMGFIGVFAAATHTPLACLLMGIELFGGGGLLYLGLVCGLTYLFSGHQSIYAAQTIIYPKHEAFNKLKGKKIENLD